MYVGGGVIQGAITSLIILGKIFSTLLYIPEIATTVWTLRNDSEQPRDLRTTGGLRVGIWVSLIGTFVMVVAVLLLTGP